MNLSVTSSHTFFNRSLIETTKTPQITSLPSLFYIVSVSLILGLIDITTLVGNSIVVVAVFSTKSLHTVTNMLIVSLAIADMLVAILVLPFSIYMFIYDNWIFGDITCDIWIGSDVLLCTASILNLCCISIDRYFAIIHPLTYTSQRSPKLARTMISIAWIASFIISCPPVFGWKDKDRDKNTCTLNKLLSYRIYSSMGSFFLPCIVMIFVYLRIFKTINDREKYLKSNTYNYMSSSIKSTSKNKSPRSLSFKSKKQHLNNNNTMNKCSSNHQDESEIIDLKERNVSIPNQSHSGNINSNNDRFNHLICCQKHRNSNFSNCSINDVYLVVNNTQNNNTSAVNSNETNKSRTPTRTLPSNLVGFKLATNSSNLNLNKTSPTSSSSSAVSSCSKTTKCKRNFLKKKQTKSNDSCLYSSNININKSSRQQSTNSKSHSVIIKSNNQQQHQHHQEQTRLARENKATKTLAIVVGCFIMSWLPFFIMYVVEAVVEKGAISKLMFDLLTWLGYFNSAINPFIYAFCSKQFRSAFYRVTFGIYKKGNNNLVNNYHNHRFTITSIHRNNNIN